MGYIADIDGATISDSSSGSTGTYIVEDEYATIHAAANQTAGTAADKPKFKALFELQKFILVTMKPVTQWQIDSKSCRC